MPGDIVHIEVVVGIRQKFQWVFVPTNFAVDKRIAVTVHAQPTTEHVRVFQ